MDANSTIHDNVEEEVGYWAANEISEAQNVVSDVFCQGFRVPTIAGHI